MSNPIYGGLLGPVGGLEQLILTTAESMSRPTRKAVTASLTGGTRAQVLGRQSRTWACEIAHDAPQEGQIVDQLEEYQWQTARPLVWYPADALGVNLLDPEASLMNVKHWKLMTPNGARVLPYEHETRRFLHSGSTPLDGSWAHLSNVPVPRDTPITVSAIISAYAGMHGYFWVDELGMDGRTLTVHKQNTGEVLRRLSFTFRTRGDTAAITLGFSRCNTVTQPQVTVTDHLTPWGVGRGCTSALVEVTEREPLWVDTGQHIYESADRTRFTVTEIVA